MVNHLQILGAVELIKYAKHLSVVSKFSPGFMRWIPASNKQLGHAMHYKRRGSASGAICPLRD